MMRTSAGKRAMLSCLVAGAALSLGLGAAVICAGAESGGTVFEENNVTVVMDPGAAIRKFKDDEIENGIRFCAVLTNSAYEALEKLETETVNVTYGMLVASAEDVAEHGALNAENVFGDNAVYYWESEDADSGKVLIHNFIYDTLPTGEDYSHAASERIIAGELTDFAADALTDELVGVAYVAYDNSAETQYLFAEDNGNSVSMTYAAQVAVEKGLDDAEGHFQQIYIDKVPESDKVTTFSVEFLFEGENGAYVADNAVSNKTYDASIGGMTSLANVPESFAEKPGYIVDTEKNAAETAKTVYANGKRTVQAYYKKAAVTGITAEVKQDAKVPSYTSVEALNPYLTVTASYEGGTSAEITEFTLAEDTSGGGSVLLTGKTGGSYEGQYYMPFSGTVEFTVSALEKTTSVEIPVTAATDTTVVQDFDNENALSADYGYGGSTNWSEARSVSGSGGSVALSPKTNTYSQGVIYSLIDVSEVDTLYYYIYFDSSTFTSTNEEYSQENLPEMVNTTFTHTGLTNWDVSVQGEMEWDTWIPIKATKKANNTETNTLTVSFYNKGNTWGLSGSAEAQTGFTYSVYLDSITSEEPADFPKITGITAEVNGNVAPYTSISALKEYLTVKATYSNGMSREIADFTIAEDTSGGGSALLTGKANGAYEGQQFMPLSGTVKFTVTALEKMTSVEIPVTAATGTTIVQDFDNENALSADYGYGGMTSRNTKFHQSGTAAAVMTTRNQTYSQGTIYCNFDISEVDTLYYYVYFDSESFSDANGVYSKENLPTMNATTFTHTGLTNWDISVQGEMKWDTWIPVKATKKADNKETNTLTVNFYNKGNTWGFSGSAEAQTGFTYSVYLDSITSEEPADFPKITGITAEVKEDVPSYTSISALKEYLTVKATYSNGMSREISDYVLAEDIAGGSSALLTGKANGAYAGQQFMPFSGKVKFTVTALEKTTSVEIPVTAVTDTTVVQDFDNADALSADYGYGGMTSRNTKFHQGGTGAAVMTTRNQTYSQGTIYCNFDISEVDTLYYYVYFDSESFTDAKGVYSKENLPAMNATTFTHTGLTNWDISVQGEMAWDTWILVKATKKANNTETNTLTVSFYNKGNTWGLSGSAEAQTGFTYSVYLDSITTVDPRGEA